MTNIFENPDASGLDQREKFLGHIAQYEPETMLTDSSAGVRNLQRVTPDDFSGKL